MTKRKINYNSVLVDNLILKAQERHLGLSAPLKDALVYFFTEPMLKHVKLLLEAGVRRIVYGLSAPKSGAWTTGTIRRISPEQLARLEVKGGMREQECRHVMELFEQRYANPKRAVRKPPAQASRKVHACLEQFARQVEQELAAQYGQTVPTKAAAAKAAAPKATAKSAQSQIRGKKAVKPKAAGIKTIN